MFVTSSLRLKHRFREIHLDERAQFPQSLLGIKQQVFITKQPVIAQVA